MNNILTLEESAQFVTYGDLVKLMEELGKAMQMLEEHYGEDLTKGLETIFDTMADIEYKRVRDVRFCMQLVADFGYISFDRLLKRYSSWCEEYDALNKGETHES